MKVTYDEYDALCERLTKVENEQPGWYPSAEEVKKTMLQNIEERLEYLIWLTETARKPKTEEMAEGRKYINQLLIKHIEFVDEETDKGDACS